MIMDALRKEFEQLWAMKEDMLIVFIILPLIVSSIIFLAAGLPKIIRNSKNPKQLNKNIDQNSIPNEQQQNDTISAEILQLCNCYQPDYLLTINEKNQYWKIRNWSDSRGLIVFTKVRLLDIITPMNKTNSKLLWKIQAKHIDFIICDNNINILGIIEIQDNSHNTPERAERDLFVKTVLEKCGYRILQTYNVTDEQLNCLCRY